VLPHDELQLWPRNLDGLGFSVHPSLSGKLRSRVEPCFLLSIRMNQFRYGLPPSHGLFPIPPTLRDM